MRICQKSQETQPEIQYIPYRMKLVSTMSSPVRVGVVGWSSSVAAAVARGAVGLRFLLRFGSV